MPSKTCADFLRDALDPARLGHELKAVTDLQEIVELGRRHDYVFTAEEFLRAAGSAEPAAPAASRTASPAPPTAASPPPPTAAGPTTFTHYEYRLADLPQFAPVAAELPRLKVMPPSADLDGFAGTFRAEDLHSLSRSPADPAYQAWHRELAARGWRDGRDAPAGAPRRDFHLVNLDQHVRHARYEEYFAAKLRVVAALEKIFGDGVRWSGSLWYPPSSYRLWHTNADQPGWRMYLVDFDAPFDDPARTSFFRYLHPRSRELVTLRESPGMVRFFHASQDPEHLFWHCIANPTERHRWSFGFVVPDNWRDALRGSPAPCPTEEAPGVRS